MKGSVIPLAITQPFVVNPLLKIFVPKVKDIVLMLIELPPVNQIVVVTPSPIVLVVVVVIVNKNFVLPIPLLIPLFLVALMVVNV